MSGRRNVIGGTAAKAGAQVQLELLRQQNEIIRLLEQLGRGRGDGR